MVISASSKNITLRIGVEIESFNLDEVFPWIGRFVIAFRFSRKVAVFVVTKFAKKDRHRSSRFVGVEEVEIGFSVE